MFLAPDIFKGQFLVMNFWGIEQSQNHNGENHTPANVNYSDHPARPGGFLLH
jgi:hypothetical protein